MIRAVTALQYLAERKIDEAIARGEFDNLPGQGRPLDLEDEDPLAPPEVRMAKRILRNAGFDHPALDQGEKDGRQRALRCLSHLREVTPQATRAAARE